MSVGGSDAERPPVAEQHVSQRGRAIAFPIGLLWVTSRDNRGPSACLKGANAQKQKSSTAWGVFRWLSGYRRSIPSPPTTAGPRHARVSYIWSPAGRSSACICSRSPHQRGWHICPRNLRLDPHIAPRLALLLPVS